MFRARLAPGVSELLRTEAGFYWQPATSARAVATVFCTTVLEDKVEDLFFNRMKRGATGSGRFRKIRRRDRVPLLSAQAAWSVICGLSATQHVYHGVGRARYSERGCYDYLSLHGPLPVLQTEYKEIV